jgi:hypothetical protein
MQCEAQLAAQGFERARLVPYASDATTHATLPHEPEGQARLAKNTERVLTAAIDF